MSSDYRLIDVACPECGEVYHLRSDAVGKRMQCHNRLCKHLFLVEPPEALVAEPVVDLAPASDNEGEIVRAYAAPEEPSEEPPDDSHQDAHDIPIAAQAPPPEPATPPSESETPPEAPPIQLAGAAESAKAPATDSAKATGAAPAKSEARAGTKSSTSGQAATRSAESPKADKPYMRRRRRSRGLGIGEIAGLAAVALLALYVGAVQWRRASEAPETRWKALQEDYREHKWTRASRALTAYRDDYPDSPHTANVPFFLDMCEAGEGIFSQTGDPHKGLEAMQRIFRKHRDSPAYADYAADLYQALGRLVERFLERARQSASQTESSRARLAADELKDAKSAHELLSTVGKSMKDAWVPERTQKLAADIASADVEVRRQLVRLEILALLDKIEKSGPELELDPINQRVEQLLASEPALAKDAKILEQQAAARRAEASHVLFTPHPSDDSPPNVALDRAAALGQLTIAVVWGRPAAAAEGAASRTAITSLARGILYVFDEQGAVRWFRRLGIDSYRPPVRVQDASTASEVLLAVSSESNSLAALDAETGKLLWSYRPQADISGPLTVIDVPQRNRQASKRRGLLPTANGEIHVLELSLGKCLGRYRLGRSMTVGGVYDPQTGLAFFPADSERVFALDPAAIEDPRRSACPSLLYTRHPSGAFRSPPSVVGQYLILPESSDLTQTRLRVFETSKGGFASPQAKPLAEQAVKGWSWFAPLSTPDRIMLATDQGELGLFGVNLDNRNEALYPIIEGGSDQTVTRLPIDGASPALAAHADGFLLWALAGGRLYKLAVDFFGQTIRSLWPESAPASALGGSPVHEAQTAAAADRLALYLTTMSSNGRRYQATAVDADEGELLWQRQLGLHPIGDPIVAEDRVLLIDANGQTLAIEPPDGSASVAPLAQPPLAQPPLAQPTITSGPGDGEADVIRFSSLDGAIWLALELPEERTLAIRPASTNDAWRRLPLVERLQGRPALLGEFLIVPCADGQLYRLRLDGRAALANEQLFRWRRESAPETDAAEIYPLSADSILLCDAKRRLRRLQFRTKDQVSQWFEVGDAYESAHQLSPSCLAAKDRVYVADDAGQVHALDIHDPGRLWRSWSLGGRASGELSLAGDRLLAVVDRRRLACLDLSGAEEDDKPRWIVDDFKGRICGAPLAAGETLLVTDASRHVTGIRRDNGERLWRLELAPHVGPIAAAAPLGPRHVLAPLADGTLLLAPLPDKAQELAGVSP